MTYLNRRDQDRIYMASAMIGHLEEWIAELDECGHKATEMKYAVTYLYKYIDKKISSLSQEDRLKYIDRIRRREVRMAVVG